MTFFVFAYCCSHASGYTALFWVNQSTIARDMEISQQAVSQHMRKLMEWGYIEKLRNQDVRRKYGKKGALWRVCFDPTMSYDEVKAVADAMPKTEEEEQAIAQETIEEAAKGAKGQQTRAKRQDKPVDNSASHKPQLVEENDKYKPQLVQENKVQLVNNSTTRTIDKDINEVDCRRLCIAYTHAVNSRWGRGFRHDLRQEQLARQLLELGYTHETFISDAESLLDWMLKKEQAATQQLAVLHQPQREAGQAQGRAGHGQAASQQDEDAMMYKVQTVGCKMYTGICPSGRAPKGDPCPMSWTYRAGR